MNEPITKDELSTTRRMLGAAQIRVQHYEKALQSIANNACCGGCLEAARVATSALAADTPIEGTQSCQIR